MNNTLTIPKKIKVGYQDRSDTYTKKLAYVIYYDNKGVLRKETSWEGWRDTSINADEYDNTPMEGFVLNKGVGGVRQSYSWNARNEYVRVFDPRGFEFEISVANLLFILQECTSFKGKGLEGEFVYSWSGKELVLLPVCSKEYSESTNFNVLQTKKITKDAMIPGRTYKFKDNSHCVYLGRHNYYTILADYNSSEEGITCYYNSNNLSHIFIDITNDRYKIEKGFTNIGEIVNENIAVNYAELLETFLNSENGSPIVDVKVELTDNIVFEEEKYGQYHKVYYDYSMIRFYLSKRSNYLGIDTYQLYNVNISKFEIDNGVYKEYSNIKSILDKFLKEFISGSKGYTYYSNDLSLGEISKILELKKPKFTKVLASGKEIKINY